jgi:hypothetical protein
MESNNNNNNSSSTYDFYAKSNIVPPYWASNYPLVTNLIYNQKSMRKRRTNIGTSFTEATKRTFSKIDIGY